MDLDFSTQEVKVPVAGGRRGSAAYPVSVIGSPDEQELHAAEAKGHGGSPVLYRDEQLLGAYLRGRRLSPSSGAVYRAALMSLGGLTGVPLEEAGRPEFDEWFKCMSSRAQAASTIMTYLIRLGTLLEHAAATGGRSRREARERLEEATAGIPVADLSREIRLRRSGREKLIAPEELEALLRCAQHPRARALISVLRESACRKGELLSLRIVDVVYVAAHVELRVLGKTGERTVPLVKSVPALRAWLAVHPDPRPPMPVFATFWEGVTRKMNENSPNVLLGDLCARAGLRHIHPHMFRHTRLTELAREGLGEYQLKSFAGWTSDSKAASWYIHLSGRAHIEAVLRADAATLEEAHVEAGG